MLNEIWTEIPTWEGLYEVSNFGRARNAKSKKLKPHDFNNYGYARVQCYSNGRRQKLFIHRLVAELFVCKNTDESNLVVNHIDGDKTNNIYTNLEWVTRSFNNSHALQLGLKEAKRKDMPCKLTMKCGTEIFFNTIIACAKSIGLSDKRLHHLVKTQGGYIPEIDAVISKCVSND